MTDTVDPNSPEAYAPDNTQEDFVNTEEVNDRPEEVVVSPPPQDPNETQDIRFIPDFTPEDPDADDTDDVLVDDDEDS
jgi:hypothetical protein